MEEIIKSHLEKGMIQGMRNAQYHAVPGFMSASGLKHFETSPLHYKTYLATPSEDTEARLLGSMVHCRTLEPQFFDAMYVSIDGHRGRNDVKAAIAEAEGAGKTVCKPDTMEKAKWMSDNVLSKVARMGLWSPSGLSEVSFFVTEPTTGARIKARPDRLEPEISAIYDIKTYSSAVEFQFRKQLYKMRYDFQAALYLRAVGTYFQKPFADFCNIVVEDEAPYGVNIIRIDDPTLDRATERVLALLASYADCSAADEWNSYPDQILSTNIEIL